MVARLRSSDQVQISKLQRAFETTLGPSATAALRSKMVGEVLDPIAQLAAAASSRSPHSPGQARRAATSIKAVASGKPRIRAGGARRGAGALFYGSEFGGGTKQRSAYFARVGRHYRGLVTRNTTSGFGPHRGRGGRWFTPAVESRQDWALEQLSEIVARAIQRAI